MRVGFRFDPPEFELTPEQAWVLARGFGPDHAIGPRSLSGRRVVEAAARLGMAARVGARSDRAALVGEIGDEAGRLLAESYHAAAAMSVARRELCRQLAEIAGDIGAPLVLLKGAALEVGGMVAAGSRESGDVDVLTAAGRTEELQRACVAVGFREQPIRPAEHELAPLFHRSGLLVEVHRFLRGVRVTGDRSATGDELLDRGLCRSVGLGRAHAWLPEPHLLLSHALVHGVAQHGAAPASYPPLKVVADVADLGLDEADWQGYLNRCWPWIGRDVSRDEAEAVWDLGRRLRRGEDPRVIARGDDGAALMLRHMVAGVVDPGYQKTLRFMHLSDPVADISRSRTLLRKVATNLWLRREEIDAIYGPQHSALRYLVLRLWRPWDLARQLVSSQRARSKTAPTRELDTDRHR